MLEQQLIEIESKLTFQEDLVQELNQVVYQQQKQIARLEAICEALAGQLADLSESVAESSAASERPPHY